MNRLENIEQQAREMCSFLLSNAGNFWPAPSFQTSLLVALEGLHVQMEKMLDALEAEDG